MCTFCINNNDDKKRKFVCAYAILTNNTETDQGVKRERKERKKKGVDGIFKRITVRLWIGRMHLFFFLYRN